MIIFSNAFVLSAAAAGETLLHPRIGYQTYGRDAGVIVTVSSETAAGPKDMPLEPSTIGYWQASALPATWMIDFGATRSIDYVGLLGDFATAGAAVKVETSMGDTAGSPPVQVWSALATEVSPPDDAPLMFLDTARNARYMRITLTGAGAVPKLAVVYAGLSLWMMRPPEMGFVPAPLSRTTELYNAMSRGGQFLGQGIRKMGVEGGVSFQRLEHDWYRDAFDPFVRAARQFPYFFAWRPEDYPREVAYVWTTQDIHPSYSEWDRFSVSWNMIGIGNE